MFCWCYDVGCALTFNRDLSWYEDGLACASRTISRRGSPTGARDNGFAGARKEARAPAVRQHLPCAWCGGCGRCGCEGGLCAWTARSRGADKHSLDMSDAGHRGLELTGDAALHEEIEALRAENVRLREIAAGQEEGFSPSDKNDVLSALGRIVNRRTRRTREAEHELFNDCVAGAWPFISTWFERSMREDVEPLIQSYMPPGMVFRFGKDCHLGAEPCKLQDIMSTTYVQSNAHDGDGITNLRAVGDLDYDGDCVIEAELSFGKVVMTSLHLSGTIVIELVELVSVPPWFSGIRVYFANTPEVDVEVNSQVLGVLVKVDWVKSAIIKALRTIIAKSFVLPNQFARCLSTDYDVFPLRCARPEGVLRLAVVKATGLQVPTRTWRECAGRTDGADSYRFGDVAKSVVRRVVSDTRSLSPPVLAPTLNPYVSVSVGDSEWSSSTAKNTLEPCWNEDAEAMHDFLVTDCQAQLIFIEVRDHIHGTLGSVEVSIADLLEQQQDDCDFQAHRFPLAVARGRQGGGEVYLTAEWRTFPSLKNLTPELVEETQQTHWRLGDPYQSTWLLFVGLYHATSLPPAPDGTEHWVTISVRDSASMGLTDEGEGSQPISPQLMEFLQESPVAQARTPLQKGLEILRNQFPWVPADVLESAVGDAAGKLHDYLVRRSPSSPDIKDGGQLVDAEWGWPSLFLLGSFQSANVTVTIWRPAKGVVKPPVKSQSSQNWSLLCTARRDARMVGSAKFPLAKLLSHRNLTTTLDLPLSGSGAGPAASVRLRLQMRPVVDPNIEGVVRRRSVASAPAPKVAKENMRESRFRAARFHALYNIMDAESEDS